MSRKTEAIAIDDFIVIDPPPIVVGIGDTFIYERQLVRMLGYALVVHGFADDYIVFEPASKVGKAGKTADAAADPRKTSQAVARTVREMTRLPLCWPYEFRRPSVRDFRLPAASTVATGLRAYPGTRVVSDPLWD